MITAPFGLQSVGLPGVTTIGATKYLYSATFKMPLLDILAGYFNLFFKSSVHIAPRPGRISSQTPSQAEWKALSVKNLLLILPRPSRSSCSGVPNQDLEASLGSKSPEQSCAPRITHCCQELEGAQNGRFLLELNYTLVIVFSVTYYLEIHNAISFSTLILFLPSKDSNVL